MATHSPVSGRALPIRVAKNPRILLATRDSPSRPKVPPGPDCPPPRVSTVPLSRCTQKVLHSSAPDVERPRFDGSLREDDFAVVSMPIVRGGAEPGAGRHASEAVVSLVWYFGVTSLGTNWATLGPGLIYGFSLVRKTWYVFICVWILLWMKWRSTEIVLSLEDTLESLSLIHSIGSLSWAIIKIILSYFRIRIRYINCKKRTSNINM